MTSFRGVICLNLGRCFSPLLPFSSPLPLAPSFSSSRIERRSRITATTRRGREWPREKRRSFCLEQLRGTIKVRSHVFLEFQTAPRCTERDTELSVVASGNQYRLLYRELHSDRRAAASKSVTLILLASAVGQGCREYASFSRGFDQHQN